MDIFDLFREKKQCDIEECHKEEVINRLQILPEKQTSYVVDDNGEPMMVFYRQNSRLFVNRSLGSEVSGYFLNIRKPLSVDVTGLERIDIPSLPVECDGIILTGYGAHNSKAYIVRDFDSQTMEMPL